MSAIAKLTDEDFNQNVLECDSFGLGGTFCLIQINDIEIGT